MTVRTLAVTAVLVASGVACGCGYHLVGASSSLPAHLTRIYIAPFINQTGRAELDQRLSEEVSQEWVRRGRLQLVASSDSADAVLTGTVTAALVTPVRFDAQGRASEYQLQVVADVQLVDRTGDDPVVLWRDPRFSRSISYPVDVETADYFDREVQAIERVARDFARGLVVTILEGF